MHAWHTLHRRYRVELRALQEGLFDGAPVPLRRHVRMSSGRSRVAKLLLRHDGSPLRADRGLLHLLRHLPRAERRSTLRSMHRRWTRHVRED